MSANWSGKHEIALDVISGLSERFMDDVLEQIFLRLDEESLKNAELVCTNWRRAILASQVWLRLFDRKALEVPLWNRAWERLEPWLNLETEEAWKKIRYLAVAGSLKRLEKNWELGIYRKIVRYTGMLDSGHSMQLKDNYLFLVNDSGTECTGLVSHTLQLSHVIQLPPDSACCCFDTDEETIVLGCEDGIVRVVDLESGQMVNQLHELRGAFIEQLCFSNGVLAMLSSDDETNQENYLLTLWRFISPVDIQLKSRLHFMGNASEELRIDKQFVVVVLVTFEAIQPWNVHILSTETHQILYSLDFGFPGDHHHWVFCYLNGLLADYNNFGSREVRSSKSIRMIDLNNGEYLGAIKCTRGELGHLRLNSKHVVALQVNPVLNIYNKDAFTVADETHSKKKKRALLCSLRLDSMIISHFLVDDFQVVVYGWNRWDRSRSQLDYQLVVLDFFDSFPDPLKKFKMKPVPQVSYDSNAESRSQSDEDSFSSSEDDSN